MKTPVGKKAGVIGVAGAVALALKSGLAPGAADRIGGLFSSNAPVSYSVSSLDQEPCEGGGAFVPDPAGRVVLEHGPPGEWSDLYGYPGASFLRDSRVEVSIQGESQRTVTLTGISFRVTHLGRRPRGVGFSGQCGGGAGGRYIEADLDSTPPRVMFAKSVFRNRIRPIRFPWTVSLTDPLLLYSGSKRGVILIGDPSKGFRLVGDRGLRPYVPGADGWEGLD